MPACALLPATIQSERGGASAGCIGNRVYTELADDELYYALPGARLADALAALVRAPAARKDSSYLPTSTPTSK